RERLPCRFCVGLQIDPLLRLYFRRPKEPSASSHFPILSRFLANDNPCRRLPLPELSSPVPSSFRDNKWLTNSLLSPKCPPESRGAPASGCGSLSSDSKDPRERFPFLSPLRDFCLSPIEFSHRLEWAFCH